MARKKKEEIQDAEFQEVIEQPVIEQNTEVDSFVYQDLGMTESDETEEESSENLADEIAEFNKTSEQYRKTEIDEEQMFLNPDTGMMVKRTELPPFEQIKVTSKSIGQQINDPKKNCKHCYGRGYTGLKPDGQPIPCDCIFKEFYKENPEALKKQQSTFIPNRKYRRAYDKWQKEQGNKFIQQLTKQAEIMQKSKDNLRKNTPKTEEIAEETHVETAEGII